MSSREELIQGIRAWLQAAQATPLTDAQVIKADTSNVRPPIPYLTVRILAFDIVVGTDERRSGVDGGGIPTVSVRGQRRATVTVRAFGDLATDWLAEAKASLYRDAPAQILKDAGLAVNLLGSGQANIAAVLADETELRSTQDLDVAYTYESAEDTGIELTTFEMELTLESDVSPDLVVDIDIPV